MEMDDIEGGKLPTTGCVEDDDSSQINISDVIEVIQTTDPTTAIAMFNQNTIGSGNGTGSNSGAGGGGGGGGGGGAGLIDASNHQQTIANGPTNNAQGTSQHQQSHSNSSSSSSRNIRRKAYVKITEQPASKALRFRYECEGRSAGSIPGVNSTPENKTFPTIEIVGYKGRAVVVVSCVTKDPPYRPHPHNLVGKEGCKKGVCTLEINSETMRAVFSNLGIQCVKKKDIESALRAREDIRVDPFKTGFQHRFQPSTIDLNSVRLCFQVFLEGDVKGRFNVPLPPVVSDPIYDKKAMSDLVICTLCSCSSTVAGGKEIILLCEKVAKEDISVRFFEELDGQLIWEGYGDFQHTDVHKQTAIKFKTPRYKTLDIQQPIKVNIQLRRPSDGATSEALPFDYLPLDSDPEVLKRKRQKFCGEPSMHLLKHFQDQTQHHKQEQAQSMDTCIAQQNMGFLNITQNPAIKSEPRDTSPLPYNVFGNTTAYRLPENSPSPQPISPQNMYNASNTPSPYNAHIAGGPMISPNHQNQYATDNISPNMNIEMTDYSNYHQNHQFVALNDFQNQLQQQLRHHQSWNLPQPHQQQSLNNIGSNNFQVNNLIGSASSRNDGNTIHNDSQQHHHQHPQTHNWDLTTAPSTIIPTSCNKQQQQSVNNFSSGNFNVNQILASVQVQTQSQSSETAPNLSSLLDMDSEQLIQFNSAELSGLSLS